MGARSKVAAAALLIAIVCLVLAGGCGGNEVKNGVDTSSPEAGAYTVPVPGNEEEATSGETGEEDATSEERGAIDEAVAYAEDANTGSTFKTVEVKVVDSWARVTLEEVGVPRDEAVGYGVYLRKIGDGEWEVVTSGTEVNAGDYPDAPEELFD